MTRTTKIILLGALLAVVIGGSVWINRNRGDKKRITPTQKDVSSNLSKSMNIISPAFAHNQPIPDKYSCRGEEVSPPLQISRVPAGTKSLALIVDDPDAPGGTWIHWLLWNVDPAVEKIEEGTVPVGAVQGLNSSSEIGYQGPCPPSGVHRYFFRLYALDTALQLPPGARRSQLEEAMKGHILAQAEAMGLYEKK